MHRALSLALGPALTLPVFPIRDGMPSGALSGTAAVGTTATLKLTVAGTLIGVASFAGGFLSRPLLVTEDRPAPIVQAAPRVPRPSTKIVAPPAKHTAESAAAKEQPTVASAASSGESRAAPPRPTAPEPSLAEQVAALRLAQLSLDRDPSRSLALLDELDLRHPEGTLHEESCAARVVAVCRLGRYDAAHAAAVEFVRRYPDSVHTPRIRASCAFVGTNSMTDPPPARQ